MKKDVFISYHTSSSHSITEAIVKRLEALGVNCWYAPRDVESGQNGYAGNIMRAIKACEVFILVLNKLASESQDVLNEVSIAFKCKKAILPFHIADTEEDFSDDLNYYIGRLHWIDGTKPNLNERIEELVKRVLGVLNRIAVISQNNTAIATSQDMSDYRGDQPSSKKHTNEIANRKSQVPQNNIESNHMTRDVTSDTTSTASPWSVDLSSSTGLTFEWSQTLEGYILTGVWYCNDSKIDIPSTYRNKPLVAIGIGAFWNQHSITQITIPDTIKRIESIAFQGCASLTNITIPNSVEFIGFCAFDNCKNLRAIFCKTDTQPIGWDPQWKGDTRATVYWGTTNKKNISDNKVKFEFAEIANGYAIKKALVGSNKTVNIPSSYNNKPVVAIDALAFWNCRYLEKILIPDTIKKIGERAFEGCSSLIDISIPDSVTQIDSNAFNSCVSLETIFIPMSVRKVSISAFGSCQNLKYILCEAVSKPPMWSNYWIGDECPATICWGVTANNS